MTAILTQRCDPYGVEIERYAERMAGGLYGERFAGKIVWHCEEPTIGRFRMICQGGVYGFRRAADSGVVPAYTCDGGHQGQVMALCRKHVTEFRSSGYKKPVPLTSPAFDGAGHEQHWAPGAMVGGSRASDMCPRCAFPPEARELQEKADDLQQRMAQMQAIGLMSEFAKLEWEQDTIRARLDELNEAGVVHKCPLILREVS